MIENIDSQETLEYCENEVAKIEQSFKQKGSINDLIDMSYYYGIIRNYQKEIGQLEEAVVYQRKLVDADEQLYERRSKPEEFESLAAEYYILGELLKELGQYSKAAEYYFKAITINDILYANTKSDKSLKHLTLASIMTADLLYRLEHYIEAKEWRNKARELDSLYYNQTGESFGTNEIEEEEDDDEDDESYLSFAFWSADGNFYPAFIDERYTDGTVDLFFLDGEEIRANISSLIIVPDDEIKSTLNSYEVQSNWENRGAYYSCKIQRVFDIANIEVIYTLDRVVEKVHVSQLRILGNN